MIFRVLDIETIPDFRFWAKSQLVHKLVPYQRIDGSGFGSYSTAAVVTEPAFPPPQAHRIVTISYVDIHFDPASKPSYRLGGYNTSCKWSHDLEEADSLEKDLLRQFSESLSVAVTGGKPVHFVSWNGRTFDLPVISLRSFLHKISCKWYYEGKDLRYRYSTEGHNDLMDFLSDYGACRPMSLADACHLVGLPGKLDMTGASVESLFIEAKHLDLDSAEKVRKNVEDYCLQDSIQTALLFVLSRYHLGKVTAETCNAILDTFKTDGISKVIPIDWDRLRV